MNSESCHGNGGINSWHLERISELDGKINYHRYSLERFPAMALIVYFEALNICFSWNSVSDVI